jgi:hypothetical protein
LIASALGSIFTCLIVQDLWRQGRRKHDGNAKPLRVAEWLKTPVASCAPMKEAKENRG